MTATLEQVRTLPRVPQRPRDAHKGTFGTVIVVGGSPMMPGAPALCAAAALRAGAGKVKIASRTSVIRTAITIEPSATGVALAERGMNDFQRIKKADPRNEAVLAVGPGIGLNDWATETVAMLARGERTMVFDADAITLMGSQGNMRRGALARLVLTPHPGEFRRIARPLGIYEDPTDPNERVEGAAKLAQIYHAVVVLKGMNTVVTDGRKVFVNQTGNPALATAGAGDVLTGVISALLAQGMSTFRGAQLGVYLHGLAADAWEKIHGPSGLTAMSLAQLLPAAMQVLRNAEKR